jgi:hypothetical protein
MKKYNILFLLAVSFLFSSCGTQKEEAVRIQSPTPFLSEAIVEQKVERLSLKTTLTERDSILVAEKTDETSVPVEKEKVQQEIKGSTVESEKIASPQKEKTEMHKTETKVITKKIIEATKQADIAVEQWKKEQKIGKNELEDQETESPPLDKEESREELEGTQETEKPKQLTDVYPGKKALHKRSSNRNELVSVNTEIKQVFAEALAEELKSESFVKELITNKVVEPDYVYELFEENTPP